MSKVEVWYMTEEERLAYIEKYPIVPTPDVIRKIENPKWDKPNNMYQWPKRRKNEQR